MIVKNVMTKNPVTILPDASVTEAKALMTKKGISKLPVLDKSNKLVGIITKNDLQKASPSDATTLDMYEIGYLLSKLTVAKAMSKNIVAVPETETVEEAARIMADAQIGCVPVMSGNLLVGIVTESDLFNLFIDMFGARNSGVRITFTATDKPGEMAHVTQKIADFGGNIVSLITRDVKSERREITIKTVGVSEEQMKKIADECGVEVTDLRTIEK